jgi:hypothetical protein
MGQYTTQRTGKASNCKIQLTDSSVTSKEVISDDTIYRNPVNEIIFARKQTISYIFNFLLTVHHSTSVQWNQRDALSIQLLWINGLYMFQALLAHPLETMQVVLGILSNAACAATPQDEQVMLETCRGH